MSDSVDTKTSVMVVEDQTAIRHMLATFLAAMPKFTVVAQAGSVSEALDLADRFHPRVIVLDWMLGGGLGLEFLQAVRIDPPPRVLVFSANTTELAVREALGAGACGYIEKTANFSEFTTAVQTIADGGTYFGPAISRILQRVVKEPLRGDIGSQLSPREREVLRFMAQGFSSKQIADQLGLSVRTVENHRSNIGRRTGLRSVAQLTLHAVQLGLVETVAGAGVGEGGA